MVIAVCSLITYTEVLVRLGNLLFDFREPLLLGRQSFGLLHTVGLELGYPVVQLLQALVRLTLLVLQLLDGGCEGQQFDLDFSFEQ